MNYSTEMNRWAWDAVLVYDFQHNVEAYQETILAARPNVVTWKALFLEGIRRVLDLAPAIKSQANDLKGITQILSQEMDDSLLIAAEDHSQVSQLVASACCACGAKDEQKLFLRMLCIDLAIFLYQRVANILTHNFEDRRGCQARANEWQKLRSAYMGQIEAHEVALQPL